MLLFLFSCRENPHQGQVPRRVHRPAAARAGEGVPLHAIHHDPPEGRAGPVTAAV